MVELVPVGGAQSFPRSGPVYQKRYGMTFTISCWLPANEVFPLAV